MESSSENSFAWTDTSSDSFNSSLMVVDDINEKLNENCDLDNDYRKKGKEKKSLSRTLSNDKSVDNKPKVDIKEEQAYSETNSISSIKKKMIKLEPESDHDLPKKKKKIKHTETNGNQNKSPDSMSYDETYLDMKVKQEESSASSGRKHKQKKRKRQSSIDSTTTKLESREHYQNNSGSEINDEHDKETSNSKKKKKKYKRRYDSDDHNLEIEDKMEIEETIVNKQDQSNEMLCKDSKFNHMDSSVTENNTLQESEESGCDEISAIKCDDHNLHTISFINKNTEEITTQSNYNDSLNKITISSQHKLTKISAPEQNYNTKSEATKQRTQRISDRIRFEDDDDINIESSHVHGSDFENNKKSSKLEKFVRTNHNLKLLSQKFNNNSSLTLDDEIWILKCPKELDIKDFNNTSLNIHGKTKIKVGGQTYDGSAEEEQWDTISLLTMEHSKYKIRNLPLSGIINLRKRIPKAHFRDDNNMVNNQTNFIPLPETKCRHPLFGSNYKKALKIPTSIAERLNVQVSEESSMNAEKRKKKKNKKDRNTSEQADPKVQSEFTMKSEPDPSMEISEKKHKKRKSRHDEGPKPKKVKRVKHDPESVEAWESEKAIEENLFNF